MAPRSGVRGGVAASRAAALLALSCTGGVATAAARRAPFHVNSCSEMRVVVDLNPAPSAFTIALMDGATLDCEEGVRRNRRLIVDATCVFHCTATVCTDLILHS